MNAYIYHPGTGTYLNPFETYFVEAPPSLGKEDFENLLVGDPDDWDVNGPLKWEHYSEQQFVYSVDLLDVDIEHSLRDSKDVPRLTKENAEYLSNQSFSRKHIICQDVVRQLLWDEEDFQEVQRLVINEVVSRYRKYDQSGKEA